MGAQYTIHMPPPYLLRTSMHFYITEKTNCRIFYITLEANSKETELVWGPHRGFHKPQEICLFPTHFNTSSLAQQTKLSFSHNNSYFITLIIKAERRWFITISNPKCWKISSMWPTYLPDQTISIEFHPFCNERWYPFLFTGCVLYLSEHHTANKQSQNMQADLFLLRPPTSLYLSLSK